VGAREGQVDCPVEQLRYRFYPVSSTVFTVCEDVFTICELTLNESSVLKLLNRAVPFSDCPKLLAPVCRFGEFHRLA
jgi:hypothetical protein